ncbi:carbohydrate kinase [Emticicia sp. CRIBPO]|uniref:FGGY-family carbohydrate kinase n=1 Tax=Emticicia sp. CRIBPO TaxID=2683258 RepID=UPI0014127618|nr:FGGY family carbohydrate kinase [Emticicia sp. CRIBPO]NBA87003.1 carbohydrate kinase [Emticicia sp. CRIBPO]
MQNVCAVFDIGKTNKKLLAFNENYEVVFEKQTRFEESLDDDGDPCDNLMALTKWMTDEFELLSSHPDFEVKALNFSAYGASLVHLNHEGKAIAPLYNYLKKFPAALKKEFLEKYGPAEDFFTDTASPDLGMLNSGLQLYWLKKQKTEIFKHCKSSLHLPQYLSFVFSREVHSELTSLGCHTALWDYSKNNYHQWVEQEHLHSISQPPQKSSTIVKNESLAVGVGIHDSSAALVPYLKTDPKPFVLVSTGTWCITLNPFNHSPLTSSLLKKDCLNYISYEGNPVRASRLFSGNEHERQVKHLSEYFQKPLDYYTTVKFDYKIIQHLRKIHKQAIPEQTELGELMDSPFVERNLNTFRSFEEAYHQFLLDLVAQQVASIRLTFDVKIPKRIYVDGGFSKNEIFMHLLAEAFFNIEVYASDLAQASSLGAAMVIAEHWNTQEFSEKHLKLKRYI